MSDEDIEDVGPTLYKCYTNVLCSRAKTYYPDIIQAFCHRPVRVYTIALLYQLYHKPFNIAII